MKKIIIFMIMLVCLSSFVLAVPWYEGEHYWKFNDTNEDIGVAETWNLIGDPSIAYGTGIYGNAWQTDGTNALYNESIVTTGIRTIDFWFYLSSSGADQYTYYLGDGTTTKFTTFQTQAGASMQFKIQGWSGCAINSVQDAVSTNNWHHFVATIDASTGLKVYINGVEEVNWADASCTNALDSGGDRLYIGSWYTGVGDMASGGRIDNFFLSNSSYSSANVTTSYNSGSGVGEYEFAPPLPTPSIDLLFSNESNIFKTVFEEDERFNIYVNWTVDDFPINDTAGTCNITLTDGLERNESTIQNFTFCDSGCDIADVEENFSFEDREQPRMDYYYVHACHEENPLGTADLTLQCGNNQTTFEFDPSLVIECSEGFSKVIIPFDECLNSLEINLTVESNLPFTQRKRILRQGIEREYSSYLLTEANSGVFYNTTLEMWQSGHTHSYFLHGTKNISASCSHDSDSTLDLDVNETITIVNRPPEIVFDNVRTDGVFLDLQDNIVIEYNKDIWNWTISVEDDDFIDFNITFYNSTLGIVYNETGITENKIFQLNASAIFRDINNPYIIEVIARDENSTVAENLTFNITDSTPPVCTGFEDFTQLNNTFYTFGASCTDESFFSLNVSCSNGYENATEGLNVQSWDFTDSVLINGSGTCNIEYCDGHTDEDVSIDAYSTSSTAIFDGKVRIIAQENYKKFEFKHKYDRVEFEFKTNQYTDKLNFTITSDEPIYIMGAESYIGWIVTGDYWLDFENDDIAFWKVSRISETEVFIELIFHNEAKSFKFKSIGKTNCVSDSISYSSILPEDLPLGDTETREFDSLEQALFWIFLTLLWLICMIASLTLTGQRGKPIGLLLILQGFIGIVVGLGWIRNFNVIVGISILVTALGVLVGKMMEQ